MQPAQAWPSPLWGRIANVPGVPGHHRRQHLARQTLGVSGRTPTVPVQGSAPPASVWSLNWRPSAGLACIQEHLAPGFPSVSPSTRHCLSPVNVSRETDSLACTGWGHGQPMQGIRIAPVSEPWLTGCGGHGDVRSAGRAIGTGQVRSSAACRTLLRQKTPQDELRPWIGLLRAHALMSPPAVQAVRPVPGHGPVDDEEW